MLISCIKTLHQTAASTWHHQMHLLHFVYLCRKGKENHVSAHFAWQFFLKRSVNKMKLKNNVLMRVWWQQQGMYFSLENWLRRSSPGAHCLLKTVSWKCSTFDVSCIPRVPWHCVISSARVSILHLRARHPRVSADSLVKLSDAPHTSFFKCFMLRLAWIFTVYTLKHWYNYISIIIWLY